MFDLINIPLEAPELAILRRLYEVGLWMLFLIVMVRSIRVRGTGISIRELAFGFTLSQSVEFIAVAFGRYRYPDWLVYFPPYPAWVPLGIGLGWAAIVPCLMRVSERIMGADAPIWKLAALDGGIAVGLDLMLDPAVSGPPLHMWDWIGEGMAPYNYWLLDVPVFNFFGWFILIGACTMQLRLVEKKQSVLQKWTWLGLFLAIDLGITLAVLQLPW